MTTFKKTTNYDIMNKLNELEKKINVLLEDSTTDKYTQSGFQIKSLLQNKFFELYKQLSDNFVVIINKLLCIQEEQHYIKQEFLTTIDLILKNESVKHNQNMKLDIIDTIEELCINIENLSSQLKVLSCKEN